MSLFFPVDLKGPIKSVSFPYSRICLLKPSPLSHCPSAMSSLSAYRSSGRIFFVTLGQPKNHSLWPVRWLVSSPEQGFLVRRRRGCRRRRRPQLGQISVRGILTAAASAASICGGDYCWCGITYSDDRGFEQARLVNLIPDRHNKCSEGSMEVLLPALKETMTQQSDWRTEGPI